MSDQGYSRRYRCQECQAEQDGPVFGRLMLHCRACGSRYSLILVSKPPPSSGPQYNSPLAKRILALAREHKLIAADIAKEAGCSREFVRQVTDAHGVKVLSGREVADRKKMERDHEEAGRRADFRREWGPQVEAMFRETRDPNLIAQTFQLPLEQVRVYLGDRAGVLRNELSVSGPPSFTRQEMVDAVRRCAQDLGIPPGGELSGPAYVDWRNTMKPNAPSQALLYVHEGWTSVVEEAGYKTRPSPRAFYAKITTEQARDAMDSFVNAMLDQGLYPSATRYEKWYKVHGAPVRAIITRRLGSWASALRQSLIRLDPNGSRQVEPPRASRV